MVRHDEQATGVEDRAGVKKPPDAGLSVDGREETMGAASTAMGSTLRHLAKHSTIYASADILAKIVGFILLPLYTRKFSTAEYGILALILILNTIPARLVAQGIPHWALKVITLDYRDDPQRRRKAISTAYYYLLLSALVVNALLLPTIPMVARWVLKSEQYNHLLVCSLGISVLQTARGIPLYVLLRARFRSVLYAILSFCEFLAGVSLNIYFVVFLDSGIAGIIYTDLIVGFAMAVIAFFIILPELVVSFSLSELRGMISFGWPLVPASLSMWLLDFADRFQLQRLSTTLEVGLYTVGSKFAGIFEFMYLSQFEKVWPSAFFPLTKAENAKQKLGQLLTYLLLGACGLGLAVVLFVDPVVKLTLEKSYWRASSVTVWLVAGFILEMVYQVFSGGLRVSNRTSFLPGIVGFGTALNLIANLWVLPRWGMLGAGFTTFCAFAVMAAFAYYYSNRFYPVAYEWGRLLRIGALFVAIVVIDSLGSPEDPIVSIPFKVVELIAFVAGVFLLRVASPADVQACREIARKVFTGAGRALGRS